MKIMHITALVLMFAGLAVAQPDDFLPRVQIVSPSAIIGQYGPAQIGAEPFFEIYGEDPDGSPAAFRAQLRRALLPNDTYADSRLEAEGLFESLFSPADSGWGPWAAWPAGEARVRFDWPTLAQVDEQARPIYYLLAVQIMDNDGVVQLDQEYGRNVAHFRVEDLAPVLMVFESRLGQETAVGPSATAAYDLASDVYTFVFGASGEAYGGEIVRLRWGLDIVDPDDPYDPGWNGPPSPVLSTTGPLTLTSGVHNLVIQAEDHMGGLTRLTYLLSVVAMPEPQDQLPVLLVDDVYDRTSVGWTGPPAMPVSYDNDVYRDAFWTGVLLGAGGPANFDAVRDVIDTEAEEPSLRTLSHYRTVIWNTRRTVVSFTQQALAPLADGPREILRYNWLGAYQQMGGNLLLAGSQAVDAFDAPMVKALPVVFESTEGNPDGFVNDGLVSYRVGFGRRILPDGSVLQQHQYQYGYRDLGLSVFDQMSPGSTDVLYGSEPLISARLGRKSVCAAMKGLVLDDGFAQAHAPAIADTIYTESTIDWRDLDPAYYDNLLNVYQWGDDEFYEEAGDRPTPFTYQTCAEGPGGQCIEPMFRSSARFDWIRAQHLAADPADTWPEGYYSVPMSQLCGRYALENLDTAKTNDQVVGFLSYKTIANKPSGQADVVWGFDPYRLDHDLMKDALHWVLGDHFGLPMRP